MRSFLARRVLYGVIAILGALLVIFVLSRLSGDPLDLYLDEYGGALAEETRERFRKELALDQPVVFQYVIWVGRYLRGQFGDSLIHQRPVITVVQERFWTSIQLGIIAWTFGTLLGVPLGIVSAVQRGRPLDYVARGIALVGQAAPVFWVGIMAILIFSGELEWLPSGTPRRRCRDSELHTAVDRSRVATSSSVSSSNAFIDAGGLGVGVRQICESQRR